MESSIPGTLLTHEPIETAITGAQAWRIRYTSLDANNAAHQSTAWSSPRWAEPTTDQS